MPIPTINYPTSIDDAASLFAPFNVYKWKSFLKLACDASETVLTLTDGDDNLDIYSGVVNNFIGISSEIMYVESVDNSLPTKTITVIRGVGDSTPAPHTIGDLVQQVFTADLHNQLREAIVAIETQIGTSPVAATTIDLLPDSDPYDYTYSGITQSGVCYDLLISTKDSSNLNKSMTVHRVVHWDDSTNAPEATNTFMSFVGAGASSEIIGLVAGNNNITIRINGCNSGSAKVIIKPVGEIL